MATPLRNLGPAPARCQIALQGGGAKILAMMAAMEGVQMLQREGRIKVTRVAGTSAGSIVAAMFAADIDLAQARLQLLATLGTTIGRHFYLPTKVKLFWQLVVKGAPLWDEQELAEILLPFFRRAKVDTLQDIYRKTETHIHVVASVLSDARKVVYTDVGHDKPIVAALLDSCAIPFCFRVWQHSGPVIVDGGLCENLPSDELIPHEKADGPALGLSFSSAWPGTQRSLWEFSLALLDTSISNSVARARARLRADRVREISTTLTTFDFTQAARFTTDEADRIREEVIAFLRGFISQQRRAIPGDPWKELNPGIMEDWWKIYRKQHFDRAAGQNQHTSLVVQANCLFAQDEDPLYGAPDYMYYSVRFKAIAEMFCSQLGILPSQGGAVSLDSSEIELTKETGDPVDFVVVPARDPEHVTNRPALVYFTPSLPAGPELYHLRLTQAVPDFMKRLSDTAKDELFVASRASVGRIDLVLHLPKRFKDARAIAKPNGLGRAMEPVELAAYPAPPGFRSIGWCGEDVATGVFGCDIIL